MSDKKISVNTLKEKNEKTEPSFPLAREYVIYTSGNSLYTLPHMHVAMGNTISYKF